MLLGYSTNAFFKYPLFDAIAAIAGLGFKGIEIVCKPPHFPPLDFAACDFGALKVRIEESGLRVTNLNSLTVFIDGDHHLPAWIRSSAQRHQIRIHHTLKALRLASFLGCRNVSLPTGASPGRLTSAETAAHFRRGLVPVLPLAEELGVKLLIEPEPAMLSDNGRALKTFIKELGTGAVGVNFDVGHFFCAGEDPQRAFEELFEWVGHVHLEDIASDRTHKHLIPGLGAIDFLGLFRTMIRLGYAQDICLELYTYKDAPREAGARSLRHLLPLLDQAGLDLGIERTPAAPQESEDGLGAALGGTLI
ncbi:MAG: sugar phosphate isomerase/epimerase family protein [bacterium]